MATNKFLSTKSFHPGRGRNRTAVFEAEQRAGRRTAEVEERQNTLKRERENGEVNGGQKRGDKTAVAFLYSQPRVVAGVDRRTELRVAAEQQQAHSSESRLRKGAGDEWCTRCNIRGHAQTSIDCPLQNADVENPYQQRLDDPQALIAHRRRQLREAGGIDGAQLQVTFQRPIDPTDPNNEILEMSDEPIDELAVERQFLAGLSADDRQLLIAHFSQQSKSAKKQKKRDKKAKKKLKREKKTKTEEIVIKAEPN